MYIPLYVKTDNSLLSSLVKIDDLIKKCINNKIASCAICDNNLFGVMEFYHKCMDSHIKPIIGLDLSFNNYNILLYAKNNNGYLNLVKIETLKNKNELTIELLKMYSSDLICVVKSSELELYDYSLIYNIFDCYIGVSSIEEEKKHSGKHTVYINEILFLEKAEGKYLPYLLMIRDGKTITEENNYFYKDNYLMNDITNLCSNDAINRTLEISDMCNVTFNNKELYMPKYTTDNSKGYLLKLCLAGLKKRLNDNINNVYLDRLKYELGVIEKMGFEDYFLVVFDYVRYAKKKNILVGPGRGSAAGSLVSYVLGITEVDPIKYNLLFERFLNPERITMPDIDTDFPDMDRDDVIRYVVDKYGKDRVANIVTFGTLGAKQALRDAGRVLNIDVKMIDFLSKKLGFNDTLDVLANNREIYNYINNDVELKLLYSVAKKIEGNKRHTSTHAAGIVISKKPLDEILPIMVSEDINQTEFTMNYLEELGLIKMDFLGIKDLTTIKNIILDINKNGNNINFNDIPLNDEKVFKLFSDGNTSGVFQFESVGMKNFLRELQPNCLEDVFAAIALFRPGPAANIPTYIARKNGKEKIDYFDKSLEDILKPTYGVIIYQEQIIRIANVMAGYSLGEADILRRAMSKKKYDVLKQEEEKFVRSSINNGYSEEISKKIYELILKFAGYGFNRSHSVSYSMIAYKMAYLKCYYPREFYANLLTANIGGESKTKEYLEEIKKCDIKVKLPSINISNNTYQVINNNIILPLSIIRNVGSVIANFIIKEQSENKFTDMFDFINRTYEKTNNRKVYESLVLAGYFDGFNLNHKTLIENHDIIFNYVELAKDLDGMLEKPELVIHEEYDSDYLLEKEKELFGFYVSSHKTEKYKLLDKSIVNVSDIKDYFSKNILIIVQVDQIKGIKTKNNDDMAFVTGSDMTGSISITLFPKIYQKLDIKKNDVLKVMGKVEKRYSEYQITAVKIDKM